MVYFQLSKAVSSISSKYCLSSLRRFIAIFQESQNLTFIKWKTSSTGMEKKKCHGCGNNWWDVYCFLLV